MCDLPVEECWVLLLNQSSKIIDRICISRGGLASTQVDVRCILREALLKRAVSMVLCHNHPSGNTSPSRDDDRLTEALRRQRGDEYPLARSSGNNRWRLL